MKRTKPARYMAVALAATVGGLFGCRAEPPAARVAAPNRGARSTEDEVCRIAAELMGVERAKVSPDTSLADLRADELDFVELILELEDRFDVTIPDDAAEAMLGTQNWQQGMKNVTMRKLAATIDERKRARDKSKPIP